MTTIRPLPAVVGLSRVIVSVVPVPEPCLVCTSGPAGPGAPLRMRDPRRITRVGGLGLLRSAGIGYPFPAPRNALLINPPRHIGDRPGTADRHEREPVPGAGRQEQATAAERPDNPRPDRRADAGAADLPSDQRRGDGVSVTRVAFGGQVRVVLLIHHRLCGALGAGGGHTLE